MSNPLDSEKPQIEIASDEDWKEKVKAEDAKLDAESSSESDSANQSTPELDPSQIPAASFPGIVQIFVAQVFSALGMFPGPDGETTRQLPVAKHIIDLLGVLEEKTAGNLTDDEAKMLDQALHELRISYVQVSQQTRQSQ